MASIIKVDALQEKTSGNGIVLGNPLKDSTGTNEIISPSGSITIPSGQSIKNSSGTEIMSAAGAISNVDFASANFASANFANADMSTVDASTFSDDQISGDKIDGGTISNFASTGITDNSSNTALTIDNSGNVGIGTDSPSDNLHVNGNITTNSYLKGSLYHYGKKIEARSYRRYEVVISAGSSTTNINLLRMRKHYWGHGVFRIRVTRTYYTSYQDSEYIAYGHTRATHSPYTYIATVRNNGGPTLSWTGITYVNGYEEGAATLVVTCPAYFHYLITIEVVGSMAESSSSDLHSFTSTYGVNMFYIYPNY